MNGTALLADPFVPTGYLLTTLDYSVAHATEWPAHRHCEHELLWSDGGVVTLEALGRQWTIPASLGVWVPAGVVHCASAEAGARVHATYFVDVSANFVYMPDDVVGVAITEPLRALLTHNVQGHLSLHARLRLQRVILDLLMPAPQNSFSLVMPRSAQLRKVTSAILRDPSDKRTTAEWAHICDVHPRTLSRQFTTETGITLTQWRILARMQSAIGELGEGQSVVAVARHLGYRNPSTFIGHFRSLTGQTPADYMQRTSMS